MKRRGRHPALWVIAVTVVIVGVVVVWSVINMRRAASNALDRGPSVPVPSEADAAAMPLPPEGVTVTIKQRGNGWLPGGRHKLHLDDITGGQVMVSVTDSDGRVILGPKSVRKGDSFSAGGMDIEVSRLENMVVGTSDFGEFTVKSSSASSRPAM